MKKITRFFLLMAAIFASGSMGFAAQPKIDFETVGNTWTWAGFESAPVWSVVANPSATGINTSATVGKLVINSTDKPWAGVECAHGDFGPFTLSAGNSTIKIMVYKDVISFVGIKLVANIGWAQPEIKVSNTKINEWEELTFDFSPYINIAGQPGPYDQIVFFTDEAAFPDNVRTYGSTSYIDNIIYDTSAPDTEKPTVFTATAGTITASDVVLKLNATDNSGAVKYTITYGTTVLNTTGTSGVEKQYTVTGLTATTDYSFSITCQDASGNTAVNNPIVVTAKTSTPMPAAPTPTHAAGDVISLYSDAYTNLTANFDPGWGGGPISEVLVSGNATKKYDSFSYKGVQLAAAANVSAMTSLHIDIYPTTETVVKVSPINTSKGGSLKQNDTSVGTIIANQWNSIDILLSTIGVDMSAMDQFIFSGGTGSGTFYMDNLYFWKAPTGINTVETAAAINCYPNPVVNNLTISAKSEMSEITVRNLLGQAVKSEVVNGITKTIDLSGLASGTYFMVAKMSNGQVSTQKISKK